MNNMNNNLLYGYAYFNGKEGYPLDRKKGLEYFVAAAKENCAEAFYVLACLYEEGTVVEKNVKKAFELFQKALDSGYIDAAGHLGDYYYNGLLVYKNIDKAFSYYKEGADNQNGYCAFMAGYIYMNHYNNMATALSYFNAAVKANVNVLESYYNIGVIYNKSGDLKTAMKYWEYAAKKGLPNAMDVYGMNLFTRVGLKDEGYMYVERAAQAGYAPAKQHLKVLKFNRFVGN